LRDWPEGAEADPSLSGKRRDDQQGSDGNGRRDAANGPLSALLSNIMLVDLDKELEKPGHKFVRYADDCNIYVKTRRAGERVMRTRMSGGVRGGRLAAVSY
jgi:hypothetical protein